MSEITIGNYLLERLKQLGVSTMFGVPGDFNLGFLDLVEDDPNMDWVGNCNELNAAYAADGYARVKRDSVGALLTTFGVGELSALNGIAGAYSEMIPVVHIVGVPGRSHLEAKPTLHHTLADGRFDVYAQAAKLFTASQAFIMREETAASEIDRVLLDCINLRRPVYLAIPIDLVLPKISAGPLAQPLERNVHVNPVEDESAVLGEVEKLVQGSAGDVIILVDVCSLRKGAEKETVEFIKTTGFPVYANPMGKAIIDEGYDRYGGIYVGAFSRPEVKEAVESAKVVLTIGYLVTDFNTGLFTSKLLPSRVIQFHSTRTQIFETNYPSVGMKGLLPKLAERLKVYRPSTVSIPPFNAVLPADESEVITQKWLWPRMSQFFKRGDAIVTETGTASFGIWDVPFADDCTLIRQILFGSIGYTVGGTLGAAIAARETAGGRTILFIGDGSLYPRHREPSSLRNDFISVFRYISPPSSFSSTARTSTSSGTAQSVTSGSVTITSSTAVSSTTSVTQHSASTIIGNGSFDNVGGSQTSGGPESLSITSSGSTSRTLPSASDVVGISSLQSVGSIPPPVTTSALKRPTTIGTPVGHPTRTTSTSRSLGAYVTATSKID